MSLDACREVGDRCGFVFKAAPYRENQGLKLRGFYVSGSRLLKRPLVFVNSAHPPVVACSSFVHELAHHVSAGIFGPARQGRGRYFNTDFSNQLTSRDELLADIMVSFAGYPKDLAEEIFMKRPGFRRQSRADRLPDPALSQIRKHLRKIYRFELCFNGPDKRQFLDYLVGAIHYAKLRWAVLSEYEL
jgi:hypothetical protein